jgi:hypothetical protein
MVVAHGLTPVLLDIPLHPMIVLVGLVEWVMTEVLVSLITDALGSLIPLLADQDSWPHATVLLISLAVSR